MSESRLRVAVAGAAGRMGREVVAAVVGAPDLELAAAIDLAHTGADAGVLAGGTKCGVGVEPDLLRALKQSRPDVLVDFTLPAGLMDNLRCALGLGVCVVVGTTGLTASNKDELSKLAYESAAAVFIAPNFAIGAVLMMQFAELAAAHLPDVEIIELHHDRKVDSPSGTALLTAQKIDTARKSAGKKPLEPPQGLVEKSPGARGASATGGVTIHSVRLPGFVAHQEVIFGGPGQILTLRHDSIDRKSFMPGVLLAVRKVNQLAGVVEGLEKLL